MKLPTWNCLFLYIGSSLLIAYAVAARAGSMELTSVTCEVVDKGFLEIKQCVTVKRKDNRMGWSLYVKCPHRLDNLMVKIKLLRKENKKKYQQFLYDDQIDICSFLETSKRNIFWGLMYQMLSQYSNFNHTCPFDHDIIVNNFTFENKQFRIVPLPRGQYQIDMQIYTSNVYRANVQVFFMKT